MSQLGEDLALRAATDQSAMNQAGQLAIQRTSGIGGIKSSGVFEGPDTDHTIHRGVGWKGGLRMATREEEAEDQQPSGSIPASGQRSEPGLPGLFQRVWCGCIRGTSLFQ